jgi:hypothetical protein
MSCFVRKERIAAESESNLAGQFFVNATASIARPVRAANAPMFRQMSRFVLKERIAAESELNPAEQFCVNAAAPTAPANYSLLGVGLVTEKARLTDSIVRAGINYRF